MRSVAFLWIWIPFLSCTAEPNRDVLPVAEAPRPQAVQGPNFLIIDIDTLSVDRVGATRDGRSLTPVIDAMVEDGILYTQAFSQSGWTLPALTALLTGRYPVSMREQAGHLSWREDGAQDLPEILGRYGYESHAWWGQTLPAFMEDAVTHSFSHSHVLEEEEMRPHTPEILAWLESGPREPFFALIHDVDLHNPSLLLSSKGAPSTVSAGEQSYRQIYESVKSEQGIDAAVGQSIRRYDQALREVDMRVGQVLDALERSDLKQETVVLLVSDHGQDLFVHAYGDHGLLFDTVLHVPFILMDPAQPQAQLRIDTVVQTIDLAPTILSRAGIPMDEQMVGQPLPTGGETDQEPSTARPVFSMSNGCNLSIRTSNWKLIIGDALPSLSIEGLSAWASVSQVQPVPLQDVLVQYKLQELPQPSCGAEVMSAVDGQINDMEIDPSRVNPHRQGGRLHVELYDLKRDPFETANLIQDRGVGVHTRRLLTTLLTWAHGRHTALPGASVPMGPKQEKALREGGYWGLVQPDSP